MTFFMRRRFGLHWPTNRPAFPWRDIAIVIACILTYGLVDRIDALADRAQIMEQAAAAEGASAQVLRDCESGAQGYYYPASGKAYECGKTL